MDGGSDRVSSSLRTTAMALLALLLVAGCNASAPGHPSDQPSQLVAPPSFAALPTMPDVPGSPPPRLSPGTPSDSKARQAQTLLNSWDSLIANAHPDAIVLTSGLVQGGGWNGKSANDDKIAFYAGWIQAAQPLSTGV